LDEFRFIPGSLEAVKLLTQHGYPVMIITNQSAIGKRLTCAAAVRAIHEHLCHMISAAGGRITDIFICSHLPEDGCGCRKPEPGLIFQAREKYGIDLAETVMVGDSSRDIECAHRAGVGKTVLVMTGNGEAARRELSEKGLACDFIASDMLRAAQWIISDDLRSL
jgi:D-glycero-D-manno-heptose 1,7-bisphosphate phosphatase